MTRTVKLEKGGAVHIDDEPLELVIGDGVNGFRNFGLTPRDLGRLIAALSRTKAARAERKKGE